MNDRYCPQCEKALYLCSCEFPSEEKVESWDEIFKRAKFEIPHRRLYVSDIHKWLEENYLPPKKKKDD